MDPALNANPVVHVRSDSDTQMKSLFDVLKLPSHGQTPFRDRNLPKSFFEQPSRPSHSRESSQDSTTNLALGASLAGLTGPVSHPGLSNHHVRSISSPAQLSLSLSAAPPPPPPQHKQQNSVDFVEEMGQLHIPPGPANWDALKSGQQRFFTGSQEQLAWPKSVSTNTLNTQGNHTPVQGALSPAQSHPSSPSVSVQNLGPLPRGWEKGVTADGEIYFINHIDRTTSWFDPRIPKHLQRPGPIKMGSQPGLPQQPPIQAPTGTTNPPPSLSQTLSQILPQPPQISPSQPAQQQQQPTQSTQQQLSPPQPPQQPTQQPAQQPTQQTAQQPRTQSQPQSASQGSGTSSSGSNSQNPQFIQYELERLKQEKDRLHREQAEIAKRELLLKEMMSKPTPLPETQPAAPPTSIQSVSTSGIDPFLGQGSTNMEAHARQNSGDSGLGGMGTSYSLPRTPEDFLSNVDEMDTQDAGIKQLLKPQGSDFNMNDLQNSVCMDMGSLGDSEQTGMESDDLVPSLQEDISNLSNDLLNDVDVAKMDNLLWL